MKLKLVIDNVTKGIDVPDSVLQEGQDFFQKLDSDMDQGWQMAWRYVENPNTLQRCQIVADRILSAMHTENKKSIVLLAAYVLSKYPDIAIIAIDTDGEPSNTRFLLGSGGLLVR